MQLDAQTFLRLVEDTNRLCCFDIEATGLHGDYNSVLVVSIKPYHKAPIVHTVERPGEDKELVQWAVEELAKYDCWVSYYGKGYDTRMLRTRLLDAGLKLDLPKKHHIDLYFLVRYRLATSHRSQGHILSWLYPEPKEDGKVHEKMTVSARVWNEVLNDTTRSAALKTLCRRCASDTQGLQSLYEPVKHLIGEITR